MKNLYLKLIGVLIDMAIVQIGFAQQEISGQVVDALSLNPLAGANILFPELKKGTSTDNSGSFLIMLNRDQDVIMKISYLGYRDTLINIQQSTAKNLTILLEPDSLEINSIVVTATRIRQSADNVPQSIDIINSQSIKSFPATNTDDLLKMIPGINVNRSWGIFSRNSSVTMRGMPGSARSLILLDGVPLNKTAGGTVSWHLVTPEEIDRIEVVKGPGSTIYGNNAMGGVINIITRQPHKKIDGFAGLGFGTYKTFQSQLNLSGNHQNDSKGIFWKLGSFYRQGDGYILEPGEITDSANVKTYLSEVNFNAMLGYRLSANSKIELDYRFYKDKRGSGIQVFEEDGSYESFMNNNLRFGYEGVAGKMKLNMKAFYFNEYYYRQNESLNSTAEYKLVDTKTDKDDYGLWCTFSGQLMNRHQFTAGLDFKYGILDNQEIYRTSTDDIHTQGGLLFSALFFQDEIDLIEDKIGIVAGLRLDHAMFYNGKLVVQNPTSKTGFTGSLDESFAETSWIQFSPKLGINFNINASLRTFINASTGFMPPKLDDMVGSRKIRRGFKIANPNLIPEKIQSLEWGFDWKSSEKLTIEPTIFYSIGNEFQYLVATGDYIDNGSEDPIPVFQRQNVSKVRVAGGELGMGYRLNENIGLNIAYTYNSSRILKYQSSGDIDLTGLILNEVHENLIFVGLNWENKFVNLSINYTYTDDQWYDEENTEIIQSYSLVNLKISKSILECVDLSLDIQDLLDEQFIDRKGYLSPGRFIMFEMKYLINN